MWLMVEFFFFKQKTAYEMRISDWSSDVCSSDLLWIDAKGKELRHRFVRGLMRSAARLTYEEVQAARDALASGDNETGASDNAAVIEAVLPGLYGAFDRARGAQGQSE